MKRKLIFYLLLLTLVSGITGMLLAGPVMSNSPAIGASAQAPVAPAALPEKSPRRASADDPNPPASSVKLVFIHHSCGDNWLDTGNGDLGDRLGANNYYVSDTYYGWGPDGIGDNTDIGHWWTWFRGSNSITYTQAVYETTNQHASYTRPMADPGGENKVIMFKSCYPNSNLRGDPSESPPSIGSNPLRGQSCSSDSHTVANAKGIYIDLLNYFETRQDKLFVVITAPPVQDSTYADNARAFNTWLVEEWLDAYPYDNVVLFDFYNALTSNGGNWETNDYGQSTGNHHRVITTTTPITIEYITDQGSNTAAYPNGGSDNHPSAAGNQKATGEFVPLLNVYYNRWQGGGTACTPLTGVNIAAPTSGYTGTLYAFAAAVSPANASTPITYTWSPAPDVGTGAVVSYTWATTGTKTITVSAGNCGGSGADSHEIGIRARGDYGVYLPLVVRNYAAAAPPSGDLLQPADLTYLGAFVYPEGDDWAYSGHALAYYPSGDPGGPSDGYPGSLYAAAHTWYDLVGEISIPAPVISTDFAALPRATALRSPADITGGWKDNCTYNDDCEYREVDGLAYLPNVDKIAWNLNDWYNVGGYDQDSLGWSALDMTGAQGVWHIGARSSSDDLFHNNRTGNYLFPAPQSFAGAHLDGKWLIAGKHREAGAFGGSQGPTLYALAPWEDGSPPASGQNLDALALLYYPEIEACVNDPAACRFPDYRPADDWGGGAWVQTADGSGILITGRKGLGDNCYGTQAECGGDPCSDSKGYHAYPYQPQILFYDPADIAAVREGTKEPWEVLPYATYAPTERMFGGECAALGAATYDRERGLLYVTEREAGPDGETVMHVWQIGK